MTQIDIYRSVLKKLSEIPVDKLIEVERFLESLDVKKRDEESDIDKIMSLAGSWKDMKQEDFDDYLDSIKELRKNSFTNN